jgi:hypothetical protein
MDAAERWAQKEKEEGMSNFVCDVFGIKWLDSALDSAA